MKYGEFNLTYLYDVYLLSEMKLQVNRNTYLSGKFSIRSIIESYWHINIIYYYYIIIFIMLYYIIIDLKHCGSDGKVSACNSGDPGSISGLGRSPG